MIKPNLLLSTLVYLLSFLLLTGCDDDALLKLGDGGIDGTGSGINIGPITGFGSIIVNDVAYETQSAQILINNQAVGIEQLKVGMYVTVKTHRRQTGFEEKEQAIGIEYRDTLLGPVDFIGEQGKTLRLLGHTLKITEDTYFLGFEQPTKLKLGDVVRISAPSGHNILPATLVEYLPDANPRKDNRIVGSISILDTAHKNFYIAGQRISYDKVLTLPADLHRGLVVEVVGDRIVDQRGELAGLSAKYIRALTPTALPFGSVVYIQGIVTRFNDLTDFDVQYRPASLSQTLINEINEIDELPVGTQISVEGKIDEEGIIQIHQLGIIEQISPVTDPALQILRASGPVTDIAINQHRLEVSGVKVRFNEKTVFSDMSGQNENLTVADIKIGDFVTVAGVPDNYTEMLSFKVNYEPFLPRAHRQVQGLASEFDQAQGRLKILGHPIVTTQETQYYDATTLQHFTLPPPGLPLAIPENLNVNAMHFFTRLAEQPHFLVNTIGTIQNKRVQANKLVILPIELKK